MNGRIRTTLVLDEAVLQRLKQISPSNISLAANSILRKNLLDQRKSMFGSLRGKISVKDIREEDHEHFFG